MLAETKVKHAFKAKKKSVQNIWFSPNVGLQETNTMRELILEDTPHEGMVY